MKDEDVDGAETKDGVTGEAAVEEAEVRPACKEEGRTFEHARPSRNWPVWLATASTLITQFARAQGLLPLWPLVVLWQRHDALSGAANCSHIGVSATIVVLLGETIALSCRAR